MAGGLGGCINHPGIEAAARCKMCGKAVCRSCVTPGPTGYFCSDTCRQKHEHFAVRAQEMDGKARGVFFVKLRKFVLNVLVAAAVLFAIGFVATFIEIPLLSGIVRMVRGFIGI